MEPADESPTPEGRAEHEEALALLHEQLGRLDPDDKAVVQLYLKGMSHKEIAPKLKITVAASRVRLHYALQKLRKSMQ